MVHSIQDHGVRRPLDRTVTSSLALLVRPVLPRLELGNTYKVKNHGGVILAKRLVFEDQVKVPNWWTVLTLGRVVQMSIQPLRGVRVVVGRRLGYVLLVRVILGQGGTRDGTPGKRTGTVRRGRLAERFLILDLYVSRKRTQTESRSAKRNLPRFKIDSNPVESSRVVMDFGVNQY